jgi:hypothetical protein
MYEDKSWDDPNFVVPLFLVTLMLLFFGLALLSGKDDVNPSQESCQISGGEFVQATGSSFCVINGEITEVYNDV